MFSCLGKTKIIRFLLKLLKKSSLAFLAFHSACLITLLRSACVRLAESAGVWRFQLLFAALVNPVRWSWLYSRI